MAGSARWRRHLAAYLYRFCASNFRSTIAVSSTPQLVFLRRLPVAAQLSGPKFDSIREGTRSAATFRFSGITCRMAACATIRSATVLLQPDELMPATILFTNRSVTLRHRTAGIVDASGGRQTPTYRFDAVGRIAEPVCSGRSSSVDRKNEQSTLNALNRRNLGLA